MPNCDFYGLREDQEDLIDFLLSGTDCSIHQMHSELGQRPRVFTSVDEVLDDYDAATGLLLLNLYSPSMGGEFIIRRIDLNVRRFGIGAHRYEAHGWGAIQFYLGKIHEGRLQCSHTNHNTEKRAQNRAAVYRHLGSPDSWNWRVVRQISSRINRYIRKLAVAKEGSSSILPSANAWLREGGQLGG